MRGRFQVFLEGLVPGGACWMWETLSPLGLGRSHKPPQQGQARGEWLWPHPGLLLLLQLSPAGISHGLGQGHAGNGSLEGAGVGNSSICSAKDAGATETWQGMIPHGKPGMWDTLGPEGCRTRWAGVAAGGEHLSVIP